MGLLDSDAEELKRNSTGEGSSGRRVNQSGLGALKSLSKYSNLTAKYRTTGKTENSQPDPKVLETVEHSRGTTDKSVQSPGEVRAEVGVQAPIFTETKLSANSVQSPCSSALTSELLVDSTVPQNGTQSPGEVSANSVQTQGAYLSPAVKDKETFSNKVSAKSVHNNVVSADVSRAKTDSTSDFLEPQVSAKSVQDIANNSASSKLNTTEDAKVRAKSVQEAANTNTLSQESPPVKVLEKVSESHHEVRAKSVHEASRLDEPFGNPTASKAGAKSVQTPGEVSAEVGADLAGLKKDKVSAKSGQSPGSEKIPAVNTGSTQVSAKSVQADSQVSAKSVQFVSETPAQSELSDKVEVSAYSVQSPGKVRAADVEHRSVPRAIQMQKSKVHVKNAESLIPTESVISISGSQRVIVDFLFQLCLWNNSLITPPITKQQLTAETGLLEETALSSIKRLRNKNIIDRYAYKDGKAGWTQYQFSEISYKELLHLRQVGAKSVQPSMFDIVKPFPSGSVQATEVKKSGVEQNWFKNLDFSKVHPIGPMVVNSAIRTLVQENLSAEVVQDFINRFTSWTSTQGRITSPIGLFCDKLKELAKEGDSPVFACMTDEEREIEAAYAAQVEKAKVEMELIRKARSESQEQQDASQFEEWYASASDEEKAAFAETSPLAPAGSEAYKRILKVVYLEKMR